MGAKPIRTATFLGHEEERNPPGLGPGDTRSITGMPDHFQLLAHWCNSSTNGFDPFGRGAEPRWAVFLSHDCPLAASPQRIAPAKRQPCAGFVNPGDRRESGRAARGGEQQHGSVA